MDFLAGKNYQNLSGAFQVVTVGQTMVKVRYTSGPQAGRVLLKRIADLSRLKTDELSGEPATVKVAAKRPSARR